MTFQDAKNLLNLSEAVININTRAEFMRVFKSSRPEFYSWDEFSSLLQEFQRITGATFKPKGGITVVNLNKRRLYDKIPEHFKYLSVNMVCQHYILPSTIKQCKNSGHVGLNCKAHIKLYCSQGRLQVTSVNFTHSNHPLTPSGDNPTGQMKTGIFNDHLDLLMLRQVHARNVLLYKNKDRQWKATFMKLQDLDPGFLHVTEEMVKSRTHRLIDNFLDNTSCSSSSNDEMVQILKGLSHLRDPLLTALTYMARTPATLPQASPKDHLNKNKNIGHKKSRREAEGAEEIDNLSTPMDVSDIKTETQTDTKAGMDSLEPAIAFSCSNHTPGSRNTPDSQPTTCSHPTSDKITSDNCVPPPGPTDADLFWEYWRHRDEEERKLREKEIRLRQEEVELRKQETDLRKQRFQFDRNEIEIYRQLVFKQFGNHTKSLGEAGVNLPKDK